MKKTGAQILINALQELGVDTIFGYPGASILSVYDALEDSSINHILTAHEQGASFCACGYARASSKVGVALATSGPGSTNLITGIADAYMDSIPMIAITGNVSIDKLGHDSFQEVDIFNMTMPITKYNMIIKNVNDLASGIKRAFEIALSDRKGPVLIDITSNVFDEVCEYSNLGKLNITAPGTPKADNIEQALELIKNAKKPIIYAGGGIKSSCACDELYEFAKKISAPVMVSFMGIGCYNPDEKNYLGVLSNYNTATTSALKECDLLISLGARFNSRYSSFNLLKRKGVKILQIDLDKAEMDKNLISTVKVTGDIKQVLEQMIPEVENSICEYWALKDFPKTKNVDRAIEIINTLSQTLEKDTTVVTDVGLHQVWTAHHYNIYSPKQFLTSGGLGAMGFGLGAGIGAYFATGKNVLLVTGDGSFQMNFNELVVAVRNKVPIIIVIMNNNSLGMIRMLHLSRGNKNTPVSTLDLQTDFVKLAESMGAVGIRIGKNEEILPKIKEAMSYNTPVVLDCMLDINEGIKRQTNKKHKK